MIDLAPGFLYSLLKDGLGLIRQKRRKLSNSEIIEFRQKWKPLFEKHVWEQHRDKLTSEIIVRDMKRIDNYPEVKETRGISPWKAYARASGRSRFSVQNRNIGVSCVSGIG